MLSIVDLEILLLVEDEETKIYWVVSFNMIGCFDICME